MANLNIPIDDKILQKVNSQAIAQQLSVEIFLAHFIEDNFTDTDTDTDTFKESIKPKRIGRYRSGRSDVSSQAKKLTQQLLRKKYESNC